MKFLFLIVALLVSNIDPYSDPNKWKFQYYSDKDCKKPIEPKRDINSWWNKSNGWTLKKFYDRYVWNNKCNERGVWSIKLACYDNYYTYKVYSDGKCKNQYPIKKVLYTDCKKVYNLSPKTWYKIVPA